MVHYLIIESHPYDGSFNHSAAEAITQKLIAGKHIVRTINLVHDRFNPVMTKEDLRLWSKGESADPQVQRYQDVIKASDVLIFPFPIWWGTMPAILKGFCDKVLLPGFAYHYNEKGEMVGDLTGKKAVVITTMETPNEIFRTYYRNPVEGGFIKDTLLTCGMEVDKYFSIDQIVSGDEGYISAKLGEITTYFQ